MVTVRCHCCLSTLVQTSGLAKALRCLFAGIGQVQVSGLDCPICVRSSYTGHVTPAIRNGLLHRLNSGGRRRGYEFLQPVGRHLACGPRSVLIHSTKSGQVAYLLRERQRTRALTRVRLSGCWFVAVGNWFARSCSGHERRSLDARYRPVWAVGPHRSTPARFVAETHLQLSA